MTTNQENVLIKSCLEGDTKAFQQLVERYKNLVFTLSIKMLKNREEAEEVSQDVFVKIYQSLNKFKGDSKLSSWIYKITFHKCLDVIKKNKKFQADVELNDYNSAHLESIDNALQTLINEERQQMIRQCINKLPSIDAVLLTMHYFDELTLEEIADIVKLKTNNVKVKLYRARQKLATILNEKLQLVVL